MSRDFTRLSPLDGQRYPVYSRSPRYPARIPTGRVRDTEWVFIPVKHGEGFRSIEAWRIMLQLEAMEASRTPAILIYIDETEVKAVDRVKILHLRYTELEEIKTRASALAHVNRTEVELYAYVRGQQRLAAVFYPDGPTRYTPGILTHGL